MNVYPCVVSHANRIKAVPQVITARKSGDRTTLMGNAKKKKMKLHWEKCNLLMPT